MLHYDRINFSEGIDINKTSLSKERDINHYWYFLDKGLRFLPNVRNGCHDILLMSINLDDIAILNIRGTDYRCIIDGISSKCTTKC